MDRKKNAVLNKTNRSRLDNLMLGKMEKPEDWYPSMSDIKSLDPNDEDDIEFMYWIYVHGDAAGEKQNEVRDYIFETIKGRYDILEAPAEDL